MTAVFVYLRPVLLAYGFLILASFFFGCSSTDNSPIGYQTSGAEDRFRLKVTVDATPCPSTIIAFELPEETFIDIDILNATGYTVRNLYNDVTPSGSFTVEWDSINDNGDAVETGIYLIRLRTGQFEQIKVTSLYINDEDCQEIASE